MHKSKKGYSLIEIGVGILILTVFLISSVVLFNGCYRTYRTIQQRNLAIDEAITRIEKALQTDANILTGFFYEEYSETENKFVLKPNSNFEKYVSDNFNLFIERYNKFYNTSITEKPSDSAIEDYIYKDKEYLANAYIEELVSNLTEDEMKTLTSQTTDSYTRGNYAFLGSNAPDDSEENVSGDNRNFIAESNMYGTSVIEEGNKTLLEASVTADEEGGVGKNDAQTIQRMAFRTTIARLPINDGKAYGNRILKIKVEVLYTDKVNLKGLTKDDIKTITLETVKVSGVN